MTTLASLLAAIVLIVGAVVAQSLEWLDRLDKHPRLKSFVEAKALRVVLLFVSVGLLAVVLKDANDIRERLNTPPPRPAPPAPINLKDLASCTTIQAKPTLPVKSTNSGISGSSIAGHDNSVVGSINQQGRNNIAQTGPNSSATINEIPPPRRIKAEVAASVGPLLVASRARVNVIAIAGDNEAQQLGVDIYNLLKNSGWTMQNPIVMSAMKVGGPFEPGVVVYFHGQSVTSNTTVALPSGHPLLALQALLQKAQLKFGMVPKLDVPEDLIQVEVGPAPRD